MDLEIQMHPTPQFFAWLLIRGIYIKKHSRKKELAGKSDKGYCLLCNRGVEETSEHLFLNVILSKDAGRF